MIDPLHLTIFDDNVLANFTAIVLEITEVPLPPRGNAGAAGGGLGYDDYYKYPERQEEVKQKKIVIRFMYNDEEYVDEKIVNSDVEVNVSNIEFTIVDNKPMVNIKV